MATPSERLEELVREYRHLQSEHRRAGAESSVRRHLGARLDEVGAEFEHLLAQEVATESERTAWRDRLHHGLAAPPLSAGRPELAFKGRSAGGSVVEVRRRPDGDLDVEIDGRLAERLGGKLDFDVYRDGDREYPEVFDAPPEALAALRAWVANPSGEPPREAARNLLEDGLIDRHFGLTERGHRAIGRTRPEGAG